MPTSFAGVSESSETSIAKLAYQLWSERGRPDGSPEQDWFRAETLLRTGEPLSVSST